MTGADLVRFVFIAGIMGGLFAGCAQPDPNTQAGRSEIAGEKCTVCRSENPGDVDACYAICMQRLKDEGVIAR
jgi:hypothetical protein